MTSLREACHHHRSAATQLRALAATMLVPPLLLIGCSSVEEVDNAKAPADTAMGTAVEQAVSLELDPSRVTLHNPGASPRAQLVYTDATQMAETATRVTVSEGFNQFARPATEFSPTAPAGGPVDSTSFIMHSTTHPEVMKTSAENTSETSFREVALTLDSPRVSVLEKSASAESAAGFQLFWQADNSGRISKLRLSAPTQADDTGRAIAEGAIVRMISLPVILPVEAIGVGAKWSIDSRVTGNSTLLQTTTYTLESIADTVLKLSVEIKQHPSQGAVDIETTVTNSGKLSVLNSDTTSNGTLQVDLTKALPIGGEVAWTTRVIYGDKNSPSDIRVVQDSTTAISFEDATTGLGSAT
ncbi:DUF6263 family protein [Corynebacterium caspium]|uniref:DUF6263 family protein n=1 Tax=Corynebacterium caspium TaxID=234828 RepID=UPI00036116E4|nr:DUF6263 family protein [Corynebacterium caspium]WKD59011.1 hypothetical protein CCASP_03035 [Corynebacterium caspium DSM 44850]